MNGYDRLANRVIVKGTTVKWAAGCLVAAVALLAGCKEYRISLSEFMAMQEGAEGLPTTQPAAPAPLSPDELAAIERELGPARVGPGDVLGIEILGGSSEPVAARSTAMGVAGVPARVDRKGEIRLPQVGAIAVAGLELEDIEKRILDKLVEHKVYTDPDQITVSVSLSAPYMTDVLVKGAATTPGVVRLRRSERNLLYALSAAGGASQIASGEVTISRLRRPGEEATFDLYDPEQLKAALALAPLESGDIVEVKAATPNTVFVGGLVMTPGPQQYPQGTHVTVLQAMVAASGLRQDLTPREATLIRRMNGHDVHVKLDLDRIQVAKDPNIILAAGDVLWVPHTVETRVQDWINKNMFFRMGASVTANYGLDYNMPGVDYLNSASKSQALRQSGGNMQNTFDPFGYLLQNQALQSLQGR